MVTDLQVRVYTGEKVQCNSIEYIHRETVTLRCSFVYYDKMGVYGVIFWAIM